VRLPGNDESNTIDTHRAAPTGTAQNARQRETLIRTDAASPSAHDFPVNAWPTWWKATAAWAPKQLSFRVIEVFVTALWKRYNQLDVWEDR